MVLGARVAPDRIIGNADFVRLYGLGCALGSAGGSRIIGNALNSIHFHCLGCASGSAGPIIIGLVMNSMHFLISDVLWGALVAPE